MLQVSLNAYTYAWPWYFAEGLLCRGMGVLS